MSEKTEMNLENWLSSQVPEMQDISKQRVLSFYERVFKENSVQNLTRLISPEDFYFGHVVDCIELAKRDLLEGPTMDLGSGAGVPGLLTALIEPKQDHKWVLAESEARKAEFLARSVQEMGLEPRVHVFSGRAEEYLKTHSVNAIIARAVGPVERIYGWIRNCSTWNNLILFKGPAWEEEWKKFLLSKYRKELKIERIDSYRVGPQQKDHRIVLLSRTGSPHI